MPQILLIPWPFRLKIVVGVCRLLVGCDGVRTLSRGFSEHGAFNLLEHLITRGEECVTMRELDRIAGRLAATL